MEKYLKIHNSDIPLLGLGTWNLRGKHCVETVAASIDIGYRHFDTAQLYENGLMITAYSPPGKGKVSRDPLLREIGKYYERTPVQVALRWLLQHGNVSVIPKASGTEHLQENMEIFDFELSNEDMNKISA